MGITLGATLIAPILDALARRITVFAHRAPTLLLRFVGSLLLRKAESRFDALLLKLPPRITRLGRSPSSAARPVQAPSRALLACSRRACPASEHAANLVALLREMEVLGLRDTAKATREAHEDAGANERAGGRRQLGLFVAPVGGFQEVRQDFDAGLDQAVARGELMVAGKLGDAFGNPGQQCFHAQRDHGGRAGASRGRFATSGPGSVRRFIGRHDTTNYILQIKGSRIKNQAKQNQSAIIMPNRHCVLAHRAPT